MALTKVKNAGAALAVSCLLLAIGIMSIGQAGAGGEQDAQANRQPAEGQPPAGAKPGAARQPAAVERFRQAGDAVAVEFSPEGTVLAAYTCGNRFPNQHLYLYSAITGERLGQVEVFGQGVNSRPFAFSPDGKVVAIVDLHLPNPRVLCCDPVSGKTVRSLSLPEPGGVGPVLLRFSPDGKRLAVAVTCNRVLLLDSATGKRVQEVGDTPCTIFSLAFSPDNAALALGVSLPSLQLWDVARGKRLPGVRQRPKDSTAASLAYSGDGALLAAGHGNRITVYDVATGQERRRLEVPGPELVNGLAYLPGDNRLVSASRERGRALVWDLRTGRVLWALDGGAEGRSLAVSPDGRAVALGTADRFIVWDLPFAEDNTRRKEAALSAADLERSWSGLAKGAPEAHQALRTLRAAPGTAVALLRRRLRPATMPDADTAKGVRRLLAQLDSDSFSERESATRALEKLGPGPEPLLREALAANPSPEARRRLERLVRELEQQSMRDWRAVKLLEHIGTPPARELLGRLAGGADARLTREARNAVSRLARRSPATR
jgi:hypothetical protein